MDNTQMLAAADHPNPPGKQIGWVAIKANGQRVWVRNPTPAMAESLHSTGFYEHVHAVFFDSERYWVKVPIIS